MFKILGPMKLWRGYEEGRNGLGPFSTFQNPTFSLSLSKIPHISLSHLIRDETIPSVAKKILYSVLASCEVFLFLSHERFILYYVCIKDCGILIYQEMTVSWTLKMDSAYPSWIDCCPFIHCVFVKGLLVPDTICA